MLAALYFSHVGTFDARPKGQRFLGDTLSGACCPNRRSECQRRFGLEGGGAGRSAALNRALLHGQKRLRAAQS